MAGTVLPGQRVTAALLDPGAWSSLLLENGWTDFGSGRPAAQWRRWPLTNEVEVIGTITGGTTTDGTVIVGGPATPVSQQTVCGLIVDASTGTPGVVSPRLDAVPGAFGSLVIYGVPSGTTIISFHGWYSLDA